MPIPPMIITVPRERFPAAPVAQGKAKYDWLYMLGCQESSNMNSFELILPYLTCTSLNLI